MSDRAPTPFVAGGARVRLTAYKTAANPGFVLEPAPVRRDWMDRFPHKWPYRCLPMAMANQAGWVVRTPGSFSVRWNGKQEQSGLVVKLGDDAPQALSQSITSFFGGGIVTITFPWLFRTDPGMGLWVRGPANHPTDSIMALEGLVETDWSVNQFTMNWKVLKRNAEVYFQKGDPVCMLVAYPLDLPEAVDPEIRDLREDPKLMDAAVRAFRSRTMAIRENVDQAKEGDPDNPGKPVWERKYMGGELPDGTRIEHHRTNFKLAPFERKTGGQE